MRPMLGYKMIKQNIFYKITSCIILIVFEINLCFSASYSGTTYNGKKSIPTTYSGIELEPIEYNGELLYPLSYHGTIIDGIYYEGIDLTNYKITTLTITGNETDSDIFNENVPAEYRVNWKKVLGKYSIGTTIIVVTGIISLCAGTVPLATAGYIAAGAFNGAITGSVIGAATDAFFSATLAFFKGEPKEKIFKEAIEASADGFMWGAITGAIAGGFKSTKELSKGIPVLNSKGKIQYVIDQGGYVYHAKGGKYQGKVFNKDKSGKYLFYQDEKFNFFDFDGKIHNIPNELDKNEGLAGILQEGDNIIGFIDPRDNLIETDKKEIEKIIKELWDPIKKCKHKEGSYKKVVLHGKKPGKSDAQILKDNYQYYYNVKVPKYAEAHHIVPKLNEGSDKLGEKLRSILQKYDIDINDPHNCVILPDDELRCKTLNMMKHKEYGKKIPEKWNTVHGHDKELLQRLSEDLGRCNSREKIFEVLADYRQAMMTNTPFWL